MMGGYLGLRRRHDPPGPRLRIPRDTYWCLADIGWITGHSYIVYGPLALGASSVLYEGVPTFPDAGRPWRIAEALGVDVFHTSPTAIRQAPKLGPEEPTKHQTKFRVMATVGERSNPRPGVGMHRGRQGPRRHRRHLVADRDRWHALFDPARGRRDEAGEHGPALPGIQPVILDDHERRSRRGSGRAWKHGRRPPRRG